MANTKCPDCGAQQFYVKDVEDQYNISSFTLIQGTVEYVDEETEADRLPVFEDTEIFCDRCAWHGQKKLL